MTEENNDNFWDDDSAQFTTDGENLDPTLIDSEKEESEEEAEGEDNDNDDIDTEEGIDDNDDNESEDEIDPLYEQGYDLFKDTIFSDLGDDYEFKATEEGFQDAIGKAEENIFQKVHQQYLDKVGTNQKAAKYLDFLIETDGNGDFEKWTQINEGGSYSEEDLDSEDIQKKVITQLYELQGFDETDIRSKLEDLEDLDLLEKESKMALKYIDKSKGQENRNLVEEGKNVNNVRQETYDSNLSILNETLSGTKIPAARQKDITDAIMQPLALKDGGTITRYDYTLSQIRNNPEHIIEMTNLLLNYDPEKGFDINKIAQKNTNTKNTRSLREKLEELENSSTISKSKSGRSQKRTSTGPDLSQISFTLG